MLLILPVLLTGVLLMLLVLLTEMLETDWGVSDVAVLLTGVLLMLLVLLTGVLLMLLMCTDWDVADVVGNNCFIGHACPFSSVNLLPTMP